MLSGIPVIRYSTATSGLPMAARKAAVAWSSGNPISVSWRICSVFGAALTAAAAGGAGVAAAAGRGAVAAAAAAGVEDGAGGEAAAGGAAAAGLGCMRWHIPLDRQTKRERQPKEYIRDTVNVRRKTNVRTTICNMYQRVSSAAVQGAELD